MEERPAVLDTHHQSGDIHVREVVVLDYLEFGVPLLHIVDHDQQFGPGQLGEVGFLAESTVTAVGHDDR